MDPDDRHTDEQGHRGRSRQRHRAVVHLPDAATERDRGADHLLDLERFEQRERATDVDEGVVATQLVQDDLARPDAVDGRLGGDQTVERVARPLADAFRQPGSGYQGSHRLGGTSPAFHGPDVDVGGCEPRAYRPRDLDLDAVEAERADGPVEDLTWRASVEQRREEHVAREATHRIDVGDPSHEDRTSARRAILAATDPAPRPSSIPTTASPSAHDTSIALSAV